MKIDDYKKLFELKHEGGWLDENVVFATCKICRKLIFDKYMIKNISSLNNDQRKKKFYTKIRHHINTDHHELIPLKNIIKTLSRKLRRNKHF